MKKKENAGCDEDIKHELDPHVEQDHNEYFDKLNPTHGASEERVNKKIYKLFLFLNLLLFVFMLMVGIKIIFFDNINFKYVAVISLGKSHNYLEIFRYSEEPWLPVDLERDEGTCIITQISTSPGIITEESYSEDAGVLLIPLLDKLIHTSYDSEDITIDEVIVVFGPYFNQFQEKTKSQFIMSIKMEILEYDFKISDENFIILDTVTSAAYEWIGVQQLIFSQHFYDYTCFYLADPFFDHLFGDDDDYYDSYHFPKNYTYNRATYGYIDHNLNQIEEDYSIQYGILDLDYSNLIISFIPNSFSFNQSNIDESLFFETYLPFQSPEPFPVYGMNYVDNGSDDIQSNLIEFLLSSPEYCTNTGNGWVVENPCANPGLEYEIILDKVYKVMGNFNDTKCKLIVQNFLRSENCTFSNCGLKNTFQPIVGTTQHFIAINYFAECAYFLNVSLYYPPLYELQDKAEQFCGTPWSLALHSYRIFEIRDYYLCFTLIYTVETLTFGFGFDLNSRQIAFNYQYPRHPLWGFGIVSERFLPNVS